MAPSFLEKIFSAGSVFFHSSNNADNEDNAAIVAEFRKKYDKDYRSPSFDCENFGKSKYSKKDREKKFLKLIDACKTHIQEYTKIAEILQNYFSDLWKQPHQKIVDELKANEVLAAKYLDDLENEKKLIRKELKKFEYNESYNSVKFDKCSDFIKRLTVREREAIEVAKLPADFNFMSIEGEHYFVQLDNKYSICIVPNWFYMFKGDSLTGICELDGLNFEKTSNRIFITVWGHRFGRLVRSEKIEPSGKISTETHKEVQESVRETEPAVEIERTEQNPDIWGLLDLLERCSPNNGDLIMIQSIYVLYGDVIQSYSPENK